MRTPGFYLIALLSVFIAGFSANAIYASSSQNAKAASAQSDILAGALADLNPKGNLQTFTAAEATLPDHDIYVEYGVKEIAERQYGRFQVRVFTAQYPAQAYGLYTFYRDPLATATDFGSEGDLDVVEGTVQFWQGARFVQVRDIERAAGGSDTEQLIKLSRAVSQQLSAQDAKNLAPEDIETAKQLPSVVRHLPAGSLRLRSARYLLGPRALARLTEHAVDYYEFYPNFGTEIALATYDQGANQMSLMIMEYHTPQQASSAFARLNQHWEQASQQASPSAKPLIKRQGNYVVEAVGFQEAGAAERTVGDVKYDYVVKWLNNDAPRGGRSIASEAAKTAKILVSVFGIIGLTLLVALITGVGFGVTKFYLRRRHLQNLEPYTDAGGMMRLNLDGIDGIKGIALPEAKPHQKLLDGGGR